MEMRICRASAVIVQRVPAEAVERLLQWQRGITEVAELFAGYRGTDVYPPVESLEGEWVTVIHFDDDAALQCWLASPVRQEWVEKLRTEVGDFCLTTLAGGFRAWFAGLSRGSADASPPAWKMALTVLFGLYPTVMLLSLLVGPFLQPLGFALEMLIGNVLSVIVLQWAVMPTLIAWLGPWLNANEKRKITLSIGGVLLILLLLAGQVALFRLMKG